MPEEKNKKKMPLATQQFIDEIVERCHVLGRETYIDLSRFSSDGVKCCGFSRRFDASKCDYLGSEKVIIDRGDGMSNSYMRCNR